MAIDKPRPAFVPTLTEVVEKPAVPEPAAPPPDLPPLAPEDKRVEPLPLPMLSVATTENIATALLQRIGPDLDRQIRETIARVLHEQMLGFNSRLQKAVAEVVHQAIVRDLSGGDPGSMGKGV